MSKINHAATPGPLIYAVVLLSGLAGLGYQMVWSRMLAVSLGHEIVAVLAVVAAFFIGLAIGASLLNRPLQHSAYPARYYVILELVIAVWSLMMVFVLPNFNHWMAQWIGTQPGPFRHWLIAFGGTLILLLPATAAMGATLPAFERSLSRIWPSLPHIGSLYSTNTLGAVIGTLAATFVLIPSLGLSSTAYLLALVNLICAAGIAYQFDTFRESEEDKKPAPTLVIAGIKEQWMDHRRLLLTLFITGFLGMGYEILVVRVLSQILENTVYSFAAILSIYLLGISLGAFVYHKLWANHRLTERDWQIGLTKLLSLTALTGLLGIAALYLVDPIYHFFWIQLGQNMAAAVIGELVVAALVFLAPTIAMGLLFTHLTRNTPQSTGFGSAIAVNTLGGALAPLFFGVVLLPLLGARISLVLVTLGYLLLFPKRSAKSLKPALVPAVLGVLFCITPLPLRFVSMADDSEIIEYREGVMASVAVIKDAFGDRHLKVNNHFTMGGTASRFSDHRQSHLPLLLHGDPKTALYLGLGTGITFEAAQYYPNLQATGVELIPEALGVMDNFLPPPASVPWNNPPSLLSADARRFVVADQHQYDVIIAEIFHPSRDGAGALYTVEHFAAIKQRLADNGLFAQWLPLFQLDIPTLKTIAKSFLAVFPESQLYLGHFSLQQPILCLVGAEQPLRFTDNWLFDRVHARPLQQQLVQLRLNSDSALFGGYLGGRARLDQWVSDQPANTDDQPLVTYQAPDFVYSETQAPAERLIQIINQLSVIDERSPLLAKTASSRFDQQLQNYWQARDGFIRTGLTVLESGGNMVAVADQITAPLLDAVKTSPDFEPAYRTLMATAQGLYQTDKRAAYDLLTALDMASPGQPAAKQMRAQLFSQ